MARKRVDKMRPNERREALWAAIRRLESFTVRELHLETLLTKEGVRDYVSGLAKAGYLETDGTRANGPGIPATVYTLVKDIGIEAPKVKRDGSEVTQGRGREQIWRTMRILGEFTARELAVSASTEECQVADAEVKAYLIFMHKAGYVQCVRPGKPGSPYSKGHPSRYRFLKHMHTGPRPPQIQRVKQVYDPNLKAVVWSSEGNDNE